MLASQLDAYASTSLVDMLKVLAPEVNPGAKHANIAVLVAVLSEPDRLARLRWSDDERDVLALACRLGSPTKSTVLGAARAHGVVGADACLHALFRVGVLLARPEIHDGKLDLTSLRERDDVRIVVVPGLSRRVPALAPPRPFNLREVPAATVTQVYAPTWHETSARLLALVAACGRRKVRVRKDRSVATPSLTALAKDLALSVTWVAWTLELALDSRLVTIEEDCLRPSAEFGAFASSEGLLAAVWQARAASSRWPDDFVPDGYLPGGILESCDFEAVAPARWALVGALARLRTTGWVRLDDLVDAAILLHPRLGVWDPYRGLGRSTLRPSEQLQQREYARCALVSLGRLFGFLEIGKVGAVPWAPTVLKVQPFVYDQQFRETGTTYASARLARPNEALPLWSPPPCDLVVRLTPLAAVLRGEAVSTPAALGPSGLHVGMDFEIVAPLAHTPPGVVLQIERSATALPFVAGDPVRRWKLERSPWLAALQGGLDGEAFLEALERCAGRPVPANVRATVAGWSEGFGEVSLVLDHDLVAFPDPAAREAARERFGGTPFGDIWLLVRRGAVPGTVSDYAGPPPRSLTVDAEGRIDVAPALDLLLAPMLAAMTEPSPAGAPGSVVLAPAKLRELSSKRVLDFLQARTTAPVPRALSVAIRGWCGEVPKARVESVEIVQIENGDDALALLARPDIAAHVRGVLPGGVYVVNPGALAALVARLDTLGIRTTGSLATVTPAVAARSRS